MKRPALLMQERPCKPSRSTLLPQWHVCATQMLAPRRKRVGGSRSKEQDRKSELVLRSTYQIFEWDRNNSDRNFYNEVRYVHLPLVP